MLVMADIDNLDYNTLLSHLYFVLDFFLNND